MKQINITGGSKINLSEHFAQQQVGEVLPQHNSNQQEGHSNKLQHSTYHRNAATVANSSLLHQNNILNSRTMQRTVQPATRCSKNILQQLAATTDNSTATQARCLDVPGWTYSQSAGCLKHTESSTVSFST